MLEDLLLGALFITTNEDGTPKTGGVVASTSICSMEMGECYHRLYSRIAIDLKETRYHWVIVYWLDKPSALPFN